MPGRQNQINGSNKTIIGIISVSEVKNRERGNVMEHSQEHEDFT